MREARNRLDSWKAIAEYLGRDVRTVIRWEKEKGLPVYRVPGGKRSNVFAYSDELDAWLHGRPLSKNSLEGSSGEASATTPVPNLTPADPSTGRALTGDLSRKRWFLIGLTLVPVLALAGFGLYLWNRPGPPVRITHSNTKVSAWDQKGRLSFAREIAEILPEKLAPGMEGRIHQAELAGDGERVFLSVEVLSDKGTREHRSEIYCLDSRGDTLWSYQPSLEASSSGRRYEGHWHIGRLMVPQDPKNDKVWISVHHQTEWPSFLLRLDATGQATVQFVNAGWLTELWYVRNSAGSYVLAAGINNEYDQSMLAVVGEDAPPSASPLSPGSSYVLENSPKGGPHRYFVFPRSELNLATDAPCNVVQAIRVLSNRIEVRTREAQAETDHAYVISLYELSLDFDVLRILKSDTYWDVHRRLENEGKVKHAARECPERARPSSVRVWNPEHGWTLQPPQRARAEGRRTEFRTKGLAVQ